jgi:isopentenyldiphosphate isomerase
VAAVELVDIVDEADVVIKQASRAEMRRQRLRHRCAYILVFNSHGKVFVHRRTATKDVYPHYWDVTVGGVVAAGEDYDTGAERELREELGFVSVGLERLFPFRYADTHTLVNGVVYRCCSDQSPRLQPEEIEIGEWVDPEAVQRMAEGLPFCPDGLAVFERYRAISG